LGQYNGNTDTDKNIFISS